MILLLLAAGLFMGLDVWEVFIRVPPVPTAVLLEEPSADELGADVEVDKDGWPPEASRKDLVDALAAGLAWAAVDLRTEEAVWNTGGAIDGSMEPPLLEEDLFCSVIFEWYKRWFEDGIRYYCAIQNHPRNYWYIDWGRAQTAKDDEDGWSRLHLRLPCHTEFYTKSPRPSIHVNKTDAPALLASPTNFVLKRHPFTVKNTPSYSSWLIVWPHQQPLERRQRRWVWWGHLFWKETLTTLLSLARKTWFHPVRKERLSQKKM